MCGQYEIYNMKASIGISDDYATIYTTGKEAWHEDKSKISFYYGYERVDPETEEWMFVAKKDGEILKEYTASQIEAFVDDEPRDTSEYLLAGIYMYLNNV